MTKILWNVRIEGCQSMVVEINDSHMESLLHHYRILTTEMVTVIRHVSETSWRICSIHWRVK
jgi:hypothetical protein